MSFENNEDVKLKFKDEMNFSEFPLASISKNIDPNIKTLKFSDEIYDSSKKRNVKRILEIYSSAEYGLPTPLDDEVILGLIQITSQKKFENKTVNFSRRQLIQVLGWREESKSYARIDESLKKWLGVTLHYEKAWWDKEKQSWVDESFHIIDRLTIYDREAQLENLKTGESSLSSFTWNDVVFNSFTSGNLKKIDFDFFKSLSTPTAKRIYRFLDKRFYLNKKWEFDLENFAFEHIGLSRNYTSSQIKRLLSDPITELETNGFIKKLSLEERYQKVKRGSYKVVFIKEGNDIKKEIDDLGDIPDKKIDQELVNELLVFRVSKNVAIELVQSHPSHLIKDKIKFVNSLILAKDKRVSKNIAGFLVNAIKNDYDTGNFQDVINLKNKEKEKKLEASKVEEENAKAKLDEQKLLEENQILDEKYYSLSSEEQAQVLEEAIKNCKNNFLVKQAKGEGTLADSARRQILLEWVG